MQVRLLGPVDLATDSGPVPVSGLRRKAILAVLALHAGDIVGTDRLIDVVWGDTAATTALNTVQSHVSYLRRLFGVRSAVVARPPGYLLCLPGEPTDVVTAERLIRAGRQAGDPARRAEHLRAALALWRGTPLVDVVDVPWLAEQADRLGTLELEARRALVDARLALGEGVGLLPELRDLAARHPFDEQVQAHLVLALYRADRQADALAVLRDVRGRLAAELGIDPGPALRELADAVLRQDPTLRPPVPRSATVLRPPAGPARNPATTDDPGPAFVGRADELATLRHVLAGLDAGGSPVVAVAGDPGIGKTRLLGRFARAAARDGHLVLWGRAAEFEQEVPFGIFRNALADRLAEVVPADLAGLAPEQVSLLREVLPTMPGPRIEASRPAVTAERYLLHRAIRALLEALTAASGLVLVLDDLHWADHGSTELLDHLLRHPPRGAVLVAVAYRDRQVSGRLRQAIGRAAQDGVARLVQLGPLSPVEAAGLLPVELTEPQRQQVYADSGGNPLYLQALARADVTGSAAPRPGDDDVPPTVRAALTAELDALPPAGALVARAAAVAGTAAEPHLLAATADRPVAEVLDALDVLVARDVLRPVPRTGRFEFRHPLVRRITYDAAGPGWLAGAHARTATALLGRGAPATEQAPHVERAAQPGDPAAVQVLQEAATATVHSNPAGAAHWLQAALRLVPAGDGGGPVRLGLLGLRAQALGLSGQFRDCRDTLHELLQLLPAAAAEPRAHVVNACAGIERVLRRHREARALLRSELDRLSEPDGAAAAVLMLGLAGGNLQDGAGPGREDWTRRALAAARRTGDRAMLTAALVECVLVDQITGQVDAETGGRLDEAALLVDAMPDGELARHLAAGAWLARAECADERLPDAVRHTDRVLVLSRGTGQAYVLSGLLSTRAMLHVLTGELAAAERLLRDARDSATLIGAEGVLCTVLAEQCGVAALRGDLDRAVRLGTEAVALAGGRRDYFTAVALEALAGAHLLAGDPETCVELLAGDHGEGPDGYVTAPLLRSTWYETAARAAAALGRRDRAAAWAGRAQADVGGWVSPRRQGLASLAAAHALMPDDPVGAARQATTAVRLFTTAGDRLRAGQARLVVARAATGSGDPEQARAELHRARALFENCGASALLAQVLREQRRLDGVHLVRIPRRSAVSAPHQRGFKVSGHAVGTEHTNSEETT